MAARTRLGEISARSWRSWGMPCWENGGGVVQCILAAYLLYTAGMGTIGPRLVDGR